MRYCPVCGNVPEDTGQSCNCVAQANALPVNRLPSTIWTEKQFRQMGKRTHLAKEREGKNPFVVGVTSFEDHKAGREYP